MGRIKRQIGTIVSFKDMDANTTAMGEKLYWVHLREESTRDGMTFYESVHASIKDTAQNFKDLLADPNIETYSGKVRIIANRDTMPNCEILELRDGMPDRLARRARYAAKELRKKEADQSHVDAHLANFIASRKEIEMTFMPLENKRRDRVTENVYFFNGEMPREGRQTRFVFKTSELGWAVRRGPVKDGALGNAGGCSYTNENDFDLAQPKLLLIYQKLDTEIPKPPPRRTMRRRR